MVKGHKFMAKCKKSQKVKGQGQKYTKVKGQGQKCTKVKGHKDQGQRSKVHKGQGQSQGQKYTMKVIKSQGRRSKRSKVIKVKDQRYTSRRPKDGFLDVCIKNSAPIML